MAKPGYEPKSACVQRQYSNNHCAISSIVQQSTVKGKIFLIKELEYI